MCSYSTSLPPGSIIAKRYEVVEELGAGAYGTVFRVRDLSLEGREFALKLLHRLPSDGADAQRRFRNEMRLMESLTHPSIVRTYDGGASEQGVYLVMELVEGISLKALIASYDGRIPPDEAASLLRDLTSAVAYAHELRILHRDLKPENIIVGTDGHAKIADFGIGKDLGDNLQLTATGDLLGTPCYMAPEQLQNAAVEPTADIYALGVIAYEIVTGRQLFDPSSVFALTLAERESHIAAKLAELSLPGWCRDFIRRACRTEPAERPDAAALNALLDADDNHVVVRVGSRAARKLTRLGGSLVYPILIFLLLAYVFHLVVNGSGPVQTYLIPRVMLFERTSGISLNWFRDHFGYGDIDFTPETLLRLMANGPVTHPRRANQATTMVLDYGVNWGFIPLDYSDEGNNLLHAAISSHNDIFIGLVLTLLEERLDAGALHFADVLCSEIKNVRDGGGTALVRSVHIRRSTVPKLLALRRYCADDWIDRRDDYGKTALFWAFHTWDETSGSLDVEGLLAAGADLYFDNDGTESTLLHEMAKYGRLRAVRRILTARKDSISLVDGAGRTALHLAVLENHPEVVAALLEAGADPFAKAKNGRTPARIAKERRYDAIVDLFTPYRPGSPPSVP